MIAIFKREFKNFFQNVIGWVFIAAFVFIAALYFRAYNIGYGLTDIVFLLVRLLLIMVFAIPVLSMRILTEDRKQKIDQLTLTSPVTVGKVIVGKYLAMMAVLTITILAIGAFPIFLSRYSTIDWGINALGLFGFLLYGAACIAICLFVSSFTESQVIAAIISVVAMFTIYLMSGIRALFTDSGNKILEYVSKGLIAFDLNTQFDQFLSGILDAGAVLYFLSIIIVFVFLTVQSVQKRRYTTSVKNFSLGAFSIISIVIVVALAILANWGIKQLPEKYSQIDLTTNRLFSICDATKNVVNDVKEPVTMYVYAAENDKDETLDKIINKYDELSSLISVEYIDPNKSPKFYENYTKNSPSYNSVFVVAESKNKIVDYNAMYITDYSMDESGQYQQETKYDIEGQLTSALNFINNGASVKLYNLTGHDEIPLDATYLDTIAKQNYTVEDISLLGKEIPEDCKMLIINSPLSDISAEDAEKILGYASKGGKLIIVVPFQDSVNMPNFNKILEYYNVETDIGFVVDTERYDGTPYVLIPEVGSDTVTNGVLGKKAVLAPYSKAIITINEEDPESSVNAWLYTSLSSYRKNMNIESVSDYTYEEGIDENGPFDVAVTCQKFDGDNTSTAYITGSTYLFSEISDQRTANASLTIFTNIVNQCSDSEVSSVVVPVKDMSAERFVVSNIAGLVIFLVLLLVVPTLLLFVGFIIWMRRRKK